VLAALIALVLAPQVPQPDTPAGTTPAVRALVETAAVRNHEARPYHVRMRAETEIAVVARRASGRREIVSVQQQASTVEWWADSIVEQHITGYRAEQVAMQLEMTRAYRAGWIVPLLAGDRIQLRLSDPASVSKVEKALDPVVRPIRRLLAEPETVATVNPLARDAARFYEYPRVDTLREETPNGDSVDVVRIAVVRRDALPAGTSVFEGDVELDPRTLLLVRLRGRIFLVKSRSVKAIDLLSDAERIVGFIDMWNGPERNGMRLPDTERLDMVRGGRAGESTSLLRFVTRFRDHVADSAPPAGDGTPPGRTLRYRVTYAPLETQSWYFAWELP
jgi:hypothetical protein